MKARDAAKACLTQWEKVRRLLEFHGVAADPDAVRVHPLLTLYLHEEGPFRPLVLLIAQGEDRSDDRCRPLIAELHKLQFASCVSRSVEGRHGILKRILLHCPSATASHSSLAMRLPEFTQAIMDDPVTLKELAAEVDVVRNARWIIHQLGFDRHAAWYEEGDGWARARKIVYRTDLETQFQVFPDVFKHAHHGVAPPLAVVDEGPRDEAQLFQHFAREHFRATASKASWFAAMSQPGGAVPGCFIRDDLLAFQSVIDPMAGAEPPEPMAALCDAAGHGGDDAMEFEEEVGGPSAGSTDTHIQAVVGIDAAQRYCVFKVLHIKPSLLKRVQGTLSMGLRSHRHSHQHLPSFVGGLGQTGHSSTPNSPQWYPHKRSPQYVHHQREHVFSKLILLRSG